MSDERHVTRRELRDAIASALATQEYAWVKVDGDGVVKVDFADDGAADEAPAGLQAGDTVVWGPEWATSPRRIDVGDMVDDAVRRCEAAGIVIDPD